jgi:hypothetical protein
MQISTEDQHALTLALSESVRDAMFANWGTFFSDNFEMPAVSETLAKRLKKSLDRGGIEHFAREFIHRSILNGGHRPIDEEGIPIREIDGFSDHVKLAKLVVKQLATLPWKYKIVVRGPAYISDGPIKKPFSIDISDQLSLVSSNILKNDLIFTTQEQFIDDWIWQDSLGADARKFATKRLYFVYRYTGYVEQGSNVKAVEVLSDEIRAFYGSCLAHDLLHPWGYHKDQALSIVFLSAGEDGFLRPHESMSGDVHRATNFYAQDVLSTKFRSDEKLQQLLSPVRATFNCSNSVRLKTAAIWLLRAHMSDKPMDKVLESTIALEVLLGDRDMSDKIGLTKLMANRCAYALGQSYESRAATLKFFNDFYKLRSEIVHSGRLNMEEDEENLVNRGIELASQMLVYEQKISS